MCQETPRMQDFAPFTLQLLGALVAHRPPAYIFQPRFACHSPPTFESVESPEHWHDYICQNESLVKADFLTLIIMDFDIIVSS